MFRDVCKAILRGGTRACRLTHRRELRLLQSSGLGLSAKRVRKSQRATFLAFAALTGRSTGNKAEEEIDLTVDEFLFPLGLGEFATKFKDIGCPHVRDIMAMNHYDLFNIGMKKLDDRKVLLSRLAVNLDIGAGPKYIKEMNLAALIESTKFQVEHELTAT